MRSLNENARVLFRISPSAERDIQNLPRAQQKHIAEQLKLPETLNLRKVATVSRGDLYRLRFAGAIRAVVKKENHYYVILRVGRKTDIDQLYASYRRSEANRDVRGAVPLERSCLKAFLVPPTPESLIAELKTEIEKRISIIEKAKSDLTDSLGVLDLADRERQAAIEKLQATVSENALTEQLASSLRTAEQRIAELEVRVQTTLVSRVRIQLRRLRELCLRLKARLRPAIVMAFRSR